MKRRNSHLGAYLILNVLVSAATTVAVLYAWDQLRPPRLPEGAQAILAAEQAASQGNPPESSGASSWQQAPTTTAQAVPGAPQDLAAVIEIGGVVGAGDLNQEYVLLKRLGEGDLNLAGWALQNGRGETYAFPDLMLYKGGAVQVYSRPGSDTATFLYWNRTGPAWQTGGTVTLLDPQGQARATYAIP
jgi:hypothetical protein